MDANYYVTVVDRLANDGSRDRIGLLAGPFREHGDAESLITYIRNKAVEIDRRAVFYGFGTVAMKPSYTKPGRLNHLLPKYVEQDINGE